MNYANLILNDELVLFANAYKCPLEKRQGNCVLAKISNSQHDVARIYNNVKSLDSIEKTTLANSCKDCQRRCTNRELQFQVMT